MSASLCALLIAGPLGADYHIGTGPEHDHRVSLLIQGYPIKPKGSKFYERALLNPIVTPQMRWGLGYCLNAETVEGAAGSRIAFWAGNGGSMSWVDLDHRLSFGYAPNRWITGPHELDRSVNILKAVYQCLDQ